MRYQNFQRFFGYFLLAAGFLLLPFLFIPKVFAAENCDVYCDDQGLTGPQATSRGLNICSNNDEERTNLYSTASSAAASNKMCFQVEPTNEPCDSGTGTCICTQTVAFDCLECDVKTGECNDLEDDTTPTDPSDPVTNPTDPPSVTNCGKLTDSTFKGVCKKTSATCTNPLSEYKSDCASDEVCCSQTNITVTDPKIENDPTKKKCSKSASEGWGPFSFKGSIVPCGRSCDDENTKTINEGQECTLCHLLIMVQNIFNLLKSLLFVVSFLAITIAGVLYLVSANQSGLKSMAKTIITNTIKGFALFMLSWIIVVFVLKAISFNSTVLKSAGLFTFTCDTTSEFQKKIDAQKAATGSGTGSGVGTTQPQEGSTATPSGYSYDPGIESQMSDASDALKSTLNCMQTRLSDSAKKISSISDGAGMSNCTGSSWSRPPCAHSNTSCHYGGSKCTGKSYAADFGNEAAAGEIQKAASECNAKVLNEGDHLHVSVGSRSGCNCDVNL